MSHRQNSQMSPADLGSLFRSAEMAYCVLFVEQTAAFACVAELGELGNVTEFVNVNADASASLTKLKYSPEIRRLDELERQLRVIEKAAYGNTNSREKDRYTAAATQENPPTLAIRDMPYLEAELIEAEQKLRTIEENSLSVRTRLLELRQLRHVLDLTAPYFADVACGNENGLDESDRNAAIRMALHFAGDSGSIIQLQELQPASPGPQRMGAVSDSATSAVHLRCLAGIITRERISALEMLVWRVCRGNVLLRTVPLIEKEGGEMIDPKTKQPLLLSVFVAFFQGTQFGAKIKKICDAFRAKTWDMPIEAVDRMALRAMTMLSVAEAVSVVTEAENQRQLLVDRLSKRLFQWNIQVRKAKVVYHTLNGFNDDVATKCLIGEFWCPLADIPHIARTMEQATDPGRLNGAARSSVNSSSPMEIPFILERIDPMPKNPPTYFRSNKFSKAFQNIVNAYGVAAYREINPAIYTTITFPFLFAVMFGDAGHGVIVLLFGLWMIIKEASLKPMADTNESFKMIFGGRFVILLMGIFSIYVGFIYNDAYSKSFNIFQSSWFLPANLTVEELQHEKEFTLDPATSVRQWPYPIGIDPVWSLSSNVIVFVNSLKMKLSVILGVSQMLFGVILSLFNHIYFQNNLNIICEFIPQLLFITSIFVYMDALIIFKWLFFDATTSSQAPSVLIGIINMVLFKYSTDTPADAFVSENLMLLQYALVIMAIISIPWMLLIKPFYLRHQHNAKLRQLEENARLLIEGGHGHGQASGGGGGGGGCSSSSSSSNENRLPPSGTTGQSHLNRGFAEIFGGGSGNVTRSGSVDVEACHVAAIRNSRYSSAVSSAVEAHHHHQVGGESRKSEGDAEEDEEHFEFAEIFIHQTIHTIEYVLGLISHTASYLRLWALSLAHSQLSAVLWDMVLRMALSVSNSIIGAFVLVAIFAIWATLTVAILCLMEGMSAFLHALRLHWVEFQSKFYVGTGHLFMPLSLKSCRRFTDAS